MDIALDTQIDQNSIITLALALMLAGVVIVLAAKLAR